MYCEDYVKNVIFHCPLRNAYIIDQMTLHIIPSDRRSNAVSCEDVINSNIEPQQSQQFRSSQFGPCQCQGSRAQRAAKASEESEAKPMNVQDAECRKRRYMRYEARCVDVLPRTRIFIAPAPAQCAIIKNLPLRDPVRNLNPECLGWVQVTELPV